MKIKVRTKTFRLITIIILATIFSIATNFIPNHNILSYIWGMLFMGSIYIVLELMNNI